MKIDLIFNFDKNQIFTIKKTRFWMIHCVGLQLSALIDLVNQIDNIGGFISDTKYPCNFLCIFLRFVELSPTLNILKGFLLNDCYICLKILALLYIRLIFSKKRVLRFYEPFINSRQIIMIKIGKNTTIPTKLGNIVNNLINKNNFYGFSLPSFR